MKKDLEDLLEQTMRAKEMSKTLSTMRENLYEAINELVKNEGPFKMTVPFLAGFNPEDDMRDCGRSRWASGEVKEIFFEWSDEKTYVKLSNIVDADSLTGTYALDCFYEEMEFFAENLLQNLLNENADMGNNANQLLIMNKNNVS